MRSLRQMMTLILVVGAALPALSEEATPEAVFATRLKPIFDSPNPSSCVQCRPPST